MQVTSKSGSDAGATSLSQSVANYCEHDQDDAWSHKLGTLENYVRLWLILDMGATYIES